MPGNGGAGSASQKYLEILCISLASRKMNSPWFTHLSSIDFVPLLASSRDICILKSGSKDGHSFSQLRGAPIAS